MTNGKSLRRKKGHFEQRLKLIKTIFFCFGLKLSEIEAMSYFACEAILMPVSIQSDYRSIGYWLLTLLTFGGEQFLKVRLAVWFAIFLEEWNGGHWFLAWPIANEVILVPCLTHGFHNFLHCHKKENHFILRNSLRI